MANEKAAIFKPNDVVIQLAEDYSVRLVYDLNAFCELEKLYDSVDAVIQMILGTAESVDPQKLLTQVKCGDMFIEGDKVTIAGTPLVEYLSKVHAKQAKNEDTLNLLWAGCLHDAAQYNEHDEIIGYNVSKAKLGSYVTFKNLREVNAKIITALLRDLLPAKNVEEAPVEAQPVAEEKPAVRLHLAENSDTYLQRAGTGLFCTIPA